jgi:hypothetical protein
MTDHEDVELVPPGCHFDVVWRGYHRRRSTSTWTAEVGTFVTDRDAAVVMA